MADAGVGRPLGASPSSEFVTISGSTASSPMILVTATIIGSAQTVHAGDAQATDVVYLQAFNNSTGAATIYAQMGSTSTTLAIPLVLSAGTSGFLVNGLPISSSGVVTVWTSTATNVLTVAGSVARTYV